MKNNEEHNESSFIYKEELPIINDFGELFITTGWNEKYKFSKEELENSLKKSWYFISVYDNTKLIGFGRVISDGIYHALIADMIIHPEYQRKGIGGSLLEKIMDKCKHHNIRDIQLFAAKDKYEFYEKYNFKRRPDDAPGMQFFY